MQVGDKVWMKTIGNLARGGSKTEEGVIRKIGKKYVYVALAKWALESESFWIKISLDNFKEHSNYSPDWQMYLSKQAILDEIEFHKHLDTARSTFGGWTTPNLTLDQLRRIALILSE